MGITCYRGYICTDKYISKPKTTHNKELKLVGQYKVLIIVNYALKKKTITRIIVKIVDHNSWYCPKSGGEA